MKKKMIRGGLALAILLAFSSCAGENNPVSNTTWEALTILPDLPSRLVPAVLPNVDMALTFGENTVSHTAGNQSRSGTYRIVGSSIEITFDNGNEATATLGSGNEYIEFEGFRYFPR